MHSNCNQKIVNKAYNNPYKQMSYKPKTKWKRLKKNSKKIVLDCIYAEGM